MKAVIFWLEDHTHPTMRGKVEDWIMVSARECYEPVDVPKDLDFNNKSAVEAWLLTWTWDTVYPPRDEHPGDNERYFNQEGPGMNEPGLGVAIVKESVLSMLDFPWPSGMDSVDYACQDFAASFARKHAWVVHQFSPPKQMR